MNYQTIKNNILEIVLISVFLFCSIYILIISPNLISIVLALTLGLLLYFAYTDFKSMEISNIGSLLLLLFLLTFNLVLFKADIVLDIGYSPYNNLVGALILGGIFLLIVIISKEKGLGMGDVRIAIIIGLLIGHTNIYIWTNITILFALLYTLFAYRKEKSLKGLRIPFVPFMVLGLIVVLLLRLNF